MENEMKKVNCSFCGNKMDCPENMLTAQKHVCNNCINKVDNKNFAKFAEEMGNVFKELGDASEIADELVKLNFNEYLENEEYKELSKEDFGKEMYFEGIMNVLAHLSAMGLDKKDFEELLKLNREIKNLTREKWKK